MATVLLVNKPFRMLSQFTDSEGRATLASIVQEPGFYPAGRLDYDSEGLLLLCDDGRLQKRISDPKHKLWKTYLLQLEGEISPAAIEQLSRGVELRDGPTRPARARRIDAPDLWDRVPPIRQRASQPTCWIEIAICEGRNRQLRRMCAHVGFPVLRLIRIAIGDWRLDGLLPGTYRRETVNLPASTAPKRATRPARPRTGRRS